MAGEGSGGHGSRRIPDPGFAGDTGEAAATVVAALDHFRADPGTRHRATLAVLQDSRVLVPVVAVLGEVEHDDAGLAHDKTSDMATVLMRGRDGRLALLAFTSTAALHRWNPDARPVPVSFRQAARAALDDDAAAVVLDVAGPVLFVTEEADLRRLADGDRLVVADGTSAWVRPAGGAPAR